jgi:hypothetical protein
MIHRSETGVSRAVQTQGYPIWALLTMAALCLVAAPRSARAAGCHTPDRPVIATTFAWETDQRSPQVTTPVARPPAVLTHPHCGDEIPLASGSTSLPAVAIWVRDFNFTSPDFCEPVVADLRNAHSQPPAIRLDRPPRPSAAALS